MAKVASIKREPVTQLPDSNVLIALVSPSHVHHAVATRWFADTAAPFATCPITQGSLLRILMHLGGLETGQALAALHQLTRHPRHHFWADDLGYGGIAWRGVLGHRQVTDAYLAALARHRGGKLVTLDRGLAALHADVATLLAGD